MVFAMTSELQKHSYFLVLLQTALDFGLCGCGLGTLHKLRVNCEASLGGNLFRFQFFCFMLQKVLKAQNRSFI